MELLIGFAILTLVIGFYISEVSRINNMQAKVREKFIDSAYINSIYNHVKQDKKLPINQIQENIDADAAIRQDYKNYSYSLSLESNSFNINIIRLDIYKKFKKINSMELVV